MRARPLVTRHFTSARFTGGLVLLCSALLACGERPPEADVAEMGGDWEYTTLDSADVPILALTEVASIPLGTGEADSPVRISKLLLTSNAIFVIDEGVGAVRRYDRAGRPVFAVDRESQPGWRFGQTHAMDARNDSLTVLDMSWKRGITEIAPDGAVARSMPLEESTSLASLAFADSGFVAAHFPTASTTDSVGAPLVSVFGPTGDRTAAGCATDPVRLESQRKRGLFGMFGGTGASVLDSLIYCWQALSPVVQVLNMDAQLARRITIAPPFYRRGEDVPGTYDQQAVERFASTWTEHGMFFPFAGGFLSVYTSFDVNAGERAYLLFLCRDARLDAPRCAMARLRDRPMAFLAPDTLVTVAASATPDAVPSIRLQVMR